jgi:phenylalanyl-tRNA synthetase beta chain
MSYWAPFWRTDIELPEDIVEEVGRLYGFDKLPRELPVRSIIPAPRNPELELNSVIRKSLSRAGANEVLTYSFVHEKIIDKAGQNLSQAYRLSNALSPDLQYYRLSILPSLLDKVRPNIKNGYDEFVLFEIGKGHNKLNVADDGLPVETALVELVYTSKQPKAGAAYFRVKRIVDVMLADIGIDAEYKIIDKPMEYAGMAPFDQTRAALITTKDGQMLGVVGELKQEVMKNFKTPEYSAAAALDLSALELATRARAQKYVPLSRFPSISQDITLKSAVPFAELDEVLRQALRESAPDDTDVVVTPISIFQKSDDNEHTQTTFRIKVTNHQKTLREAEVSAMLDHVAQACHDKLSAEKI